MEKHAFYDKILTRTSPANAKAITDALVNAGLLSSLTFLKDGQTTSVFDIKDSNMVLKIFDRRIRINPRIFGSKYQLQDDYRRILKDESEKDVKNNPTEVVIEIEPQLTDKGITALHQEMLRYKLWTDEGVEFWDILPPPSNRHEIKNAMLDHRGVPYVIDEDATKIVQDTSYPADANGKRTDEQYRDWRANNWDQHGRADIISDKKFSEIKDACIKCDWPEDQAPIFSSRINHQVLSKFREVFDEIPNISAEKKWSTKKVTPPSASIQGGYQGAQTPTPKRG
jgi:hypothetical protein